MIIVQLIEGLTNGTHAKKMIYSRYIKYLKSISRNRRPAIRALLNSVQDKVWSVTGSNIRTILLDSGVNVRPGETNQGALRSPVT